MLHIPGISGEIIWVTGASSGIGGALALQLAEAGNTVLISARNAAALDAVAARHPRIESLPCDVTQEASLRSAAGRIRIRHGRIDRVFINAGTCEYLDIQAPDWSLVERVMQVNFSGAVNTVAVALPLLLTSAASAVDRPRPHILVIGSLASELPFPRAEAYGASKAAVKYFFESLAMDLLPQGVAVTIVQPGFVDTPLTRENGFPMPFLMPVEKAAEIILREAARYPRRIRFPWRLSALLSMMGLMPWLWTRVMARRA
jgi:NAD(P)-dependent dehydrogenase (short-subunit alcohol dehydrogenase family)